MATSEVGHFGVHFERGSQRLAMQLSVKIENISYATHNFPSKRLGS